MGKHMHTNTHTGKNIIILGRRVKKKLLKPGERWCLSAARSLDELTDLKQAGLWAK